MSKEQQPKPKQDIDLEALKEAKKKHDKQKGCQEIVRK